MTDFPLPRLAGEIDEQRLRALLLGGLALLILLAFIPTGMTLAAGPWETEQEGHGPFILAAAAWFAWGKREELKAAAFSSAPLPGWAALTGGLALLLVGRSQEVLAVETFAAIPILAGVVLLFAGWRALRILAFPIGLMMFAVPMPGWFMDALTIPLKSMVSDVVTRLLYRLGFPIAQNGVVIMIGPYQLLVKDACSGMNSIFALSAIGVIYIHMMQYASRLRNLLILLAILPITVAANFIRVTGLVLIAYYFGSAAIEGIIHDVTGVALFAVSFALVILFDGLLAVIFAAAARAWRMAKAAS